MRAKPMTAPALLRRRLSPGADAWRCGALDRAHRNACSDVSAQRSQPTQGWALVWFWPLLASHSIERSVFFQRKKSREASSDKVDSNQSLGLVFGRLAMGGHNIMRHLIFWALGTCFLIVACATGNSADTSEAPLGIIPERNESSNTLIVFVHGLGDDSVNAWRNPDNGAYWPSLVASDDTFNGADIAVYGYPTDVLRGTYTIDDVATDLNRQLQSFQLRHTYENTIFVAHSMGGLVVRAYLLKHREEIELPKFIYFLGTPTNGSSIANLARLISSSPQVKGLVDFPDNLYLRSQSSQWQASALRTEIKTYCAFEVLRTSGVKVVPQASATALCNDRFEPIHENHIRMSKPKGLTSEAHISFRLAYAETIGDLRLITGSQSIRIAQDDVSRRGPVTLTGNEIRVEEDLSLPPGSLIVANHLNLGDHIVSGDDFTVIASTMVGGTLDSSGSSPGSSGGVITIAAGRIAGTRITAAGATGLDGSDGGDGVDGSPGTEGRRGNCRAGSYRGAQRGGDGGNGTDGEAGEDGGNGGNGGTIYLLSVEAYGSQIDVAPGNFGLGGRGGQGGRPGSGGTGGRGCTGLGGSQENAPAGRIGRIGFDGRDGREGRSGSFGFVWNKQVESLRTIADLIPADDEIEDYREEITRSIRHAAGGGWEGAAR